MADETKVKANMKRSASQVQEYVKRVRKEIFAATVDVERMNESLARKSAHQVYISAPSREDLPASTDEDSHEALVARAVATARAAGTVGYLARCNPHPRDALVTFTEDTHKYTYRGKPVGISTTAFIDIFIPEFTADIISFSMVCKESFPTDVKYSVYHEMPHLMRAVRKRRFDEAAQIVREKWESDRQNASAKGTHVHGVLERHVNCKVFFTEYLKGAEDKTFEDKAKQDADIDGDKPIEISDLLQEVHPQRKFTYSTGIVDYCRQELYQFLRYHEYRARLGYVDYRTEWRIVADKYDLAGSIDLVQTCTDASLNDPENNREALRTGRKIIHLVDYKISSKVGNPAFNGAMAIGPMFHWDASKKTLYSMQLGIYRFILESVYRYHVASMQIVAFHNELSDYVMIPVTIERTLVHRLMQIRGEMVTRNLSVVDMRNRVVHYR